MKVLYLGHYREGTGWSTSSINNILALNTLDIDLVTRNIRLTKELEVPEEILQLEKKDLQNIDVCIQHVLPHHLVATNKFKKAPISTKIIAPTIAPVNLFNIDFEKKFAK